MGGTPFQETAHFKMIPWMLREFHLKTKQNLQNSSPSETSGVPWTEKQTPLVLLHIVQAEGAWPEWALPKERRRVQAAKE